MWSEPHCCWNNNLPFACRESRELTNICKCFFSALPPLCMWIWVVTSRFMAAGMKTEMPPPAAHVGQSSVTNCVFCDNSDAEVNTVYRCRSCSSFAGSKFKPEGTTWSNKTKWNTQNWKDQSERWGKQKPHSFGACFQSAFLHDYLLRGPCQQTDVEPQLWCDLTSVHTTCLLSQFDILKL